MKAFISYFYRQVAKTNETCGIRRIICLRCNFYVRQVILDVQQFSPNEITVKTVDNCVIVEAKHEEKKDEHGFISRQFVRRYVVPSSHDLLSITSSLSSDGVLTISAPKKVKFADQMLDEE